MNGSSRSIQVLQLIGAAPGAVALLASALFGAACGSTGEASTGAGDASSDSNVQTHVDAGKDARPHAGDSGSDTKPASHDAGQDTTEPSSDAKGDSPATGHDAGPGTDAGRDGGGGDACSGTCVLAGQQDFPTGIAVDDTSVYWVNDGPTGSVVKVAVAGGTPVTLTKGHSNSVGIAIDSTSIYFTTTESIVKMPLDGEPDGGVETLASGTDVNAPSCIAVDANDVYWANNGGLDSGDVGSIVKVPIIGGSPVTLASHLLNPYGIAVDSNNVYWTTADSVMQLAKAPPADGGVSAPVVMASNQNTPWTIAVDVANVYWPTIMDGTVVKAPILAGTPTTLVTGQTSPWGVATDGTNVYWTTDVDPAGTVVQLGVMGGTSTTIATAQVQPQFVAVHAGRVHWTDDSGNIVTWTASQ